ncbi:MAG: PaaI family thioesterase [Arenicellales bacterium]
MTRSARSCASPPCTQRHTRPGGPGTGDERRIHARPLAKHYNPLGTVHGGWFAALLDSALGCAVHSTLPAGKGYTTFEIKLNTVRALTVAVPLVRAQGRVLHAGRQVATAQARLAGPDDKLYAHATTTCLVFDRLPLPGRNSLDRAADGEAPSSREGRLASGQG